MKHIRVERCQDCKHFGHPDDYLDDWIGGTCTKRNARVDNMCQVDEGCDLEEDRIESVCEMLDLVIWAHDGIPPSASNDEYKRNVIAQAKALLKEVRK